MVNLYSNSCKFTRHGEVVVSARPASTSHEVVGVAYKLEVKVKDNNIRVKAEHMGRLLRPFSQVDVPMTRKYGGTGKHGNRTVL